MMLIRDVHTDGADDDNKGTIRDYNADLWKQWWWQWWINNDDGDDDSDDDDDDNENYDENYDYKLIAMTNLQG